jgi:hypothetical protein
MDTLQKNIIQQIKNTDNNELLLYIKSILDNESQKPYYLNSIEMQLIKESEHDYNKGDTVDNNEVFDKIDKWLEEE